MNKDVGSVWGAILLVAGCSIGAGMLGVPVISGLSGFQPSVLMFLFSWLFMVTTGLLLVEVNLWFPGEVSLVSMSGKTLGNAGKIACWVLFLFLFYCVMVAYVSGCGQLLTDFVHDVTGGTIPTWIGSTLCTVLFGILIYLGTSAVDHTNRVLMGGLFLTYAILLAVGIPHIKLELLEHRDWSVAALAIPAMVIGFGFHNLVPTLTTYLNHKRCHLVTVVIIGSLIPLIVYLLWEAVILGIVPFGDEGSIFHQALNEGGLATQALRIGGGPQWVVDVAQYFAFFAIITSFLGVALSFVDFLADGLKMKKVGLRKVGLCALVVTPPYIFALVYPHLFLTALNIGSTFGAVILFGVLPALMTWRGRDGIGKNAPRIVPGGKLVLILVIVAAIAIMGIQFWQ